MRLIRLIRLVAEGDDVIVEDGWFRVQAFRAFAFI